MNDANGSASPRSPLMERAETLVGSVGSKLKEAQSNWEEKPLSAAESAFSSEAHETATQAEAKLQPATDRAEAALERTGERLGAFIAAFSHRVRKATALVREGAEDIVAEAQSFRRPNASS